MKNLINYIISKSSSFETRIENDITVFQSEGNLTETLAKLGFSRHQFQNHQSGKKEFSNLYYNYQQDESKGLFVHHNPHNNTWICQILDNGNYDKFI